MNRSVRGLLTVASAVVTGVLVASFGPPDPVTQLPVAGTVAVVAAPVVYAAVGRAEAGRADEDAP